MRQPFSLNTKKVLMLNSSTTLPRTNNHHIIVLNWEFTCKSQIKNPFSDEKEEITDHLVDIFLTISQVSTRNHLLPRLRRIGDKRKEQAGLRGLQKDPMKWFIRH
tara:strand:- start:1699 stop:2013 length:315 start_codon:yes stop_codon:yes gene_type:complete